MRSMSLEENGTGERTLLGRYIVADPEICHGQPTFLGTRIMVSQVVKQVGRGLSVDAIIREWHGKITEDAIAEAVELASRVLVEHPAQCAVESRAG
jgi:uncharacterized protein (DUF433 family)